MNLSRKLFTAFTLAVLTACGDAQTPAPAEPAAVEESAPAASLQARFNLNTATEAELLTIPEVGERMVGEFLEYRPYASIGEFREEIGKYVSEEQVAAYERYVYVPVDPNRSDAETLQQLPGLDETEAAELIAGRPYASNGAFLEKLASYVGSDELGAAGSYLTAE